MRNELKLLSDKSLEMVSGGSLRGCLKVAMYSVLSSAIATEGCVIMNDLSADGNELRNTRIDRSKAVGDFSWRLKPGIANAVDVAGNAALDLHNDLIDALRRPTPVVAVAPQNQTVSQ